MEAYQYKIRIEKSKSEIIDFDINDVLLENSRIKIIDKPTATSVVLEYEWLGTMPYITKYHFGIYFIINDIEYLGGVLCFGNDYAENTGVWNKYCFDDKLLLLNRGVCLWWTPKNTASYFISRVCKWIKQNTQYKIITATVDPMAGEIGTIYQSLNWHYVGLMSGNYNNKIESKRFSVLIDGKLRYSRWIRNKIGSMRKEHIIEHYPNAIFIPQYRKRRYFHFIDTPTMNKKYKSNINHLIQSYPKRNDNVIGIIYQIENKINNKKYIGQTIRTLVARIEDYKKGLGNDYINNAFNKYGWDNLEFTIIDTASTINELNNKEIYYINKYKTNDRHNGYNIEFGGNNKIPSTETIEKMSRSHIGKKQNNSWILNRIALANSDEAKKYGRRKSNDEKKYLSEKSPKYWLGKTRDIETKEKISKTIKKKNLSANQNQVSVKTVFLKNTQTNEIIQTYESTKQASLIIGVNQSTISRWCKNNKIIDDKLWTYNRN